MRKLLLGCVAAFALLLVLPCMANAAEDERPVLLNVLGAKQEARQQDFKDEPANVEAAEDAVAPGTPEAPAIQEVSASAYVAIEAEPTPMGALSSPLGFTSLQEEESRLLSLLNQQRIDAGINPLTLDDRLSAAASVRAAEASVRWSHTRPDGSLWNTVTANVAGENLAFGYANARMAVDAWMSSEGHRRNILDASFKRTGVAAMDIDGVRYWVQLFGR